MKLKLDNTNLKISLLISIIFYSITTFVLSIIKLNSIRFPDLQEVYLNIRQYEKYIIKEELLQKPSTRPTNRASQKKVKKEEFNKVGNHNNAIVTTAEIDSTLHLEVDVPVKNNNWLDSMVIKNPSILMLKYAAKDKLNNDSTKISDSAKTAETIKNVMQNYFRSKYPTPVHKFGDGSPGIPIDKIVDLFSKEDTVDVKKIKKYLKLEGYQ